MNFKAILCLLLLSISLQSCQGRHLSHEGDFFDEDEEDFPRNEPDYDEGIDEDQLADIFRQALLHARDSGINDEEDQENEEPVEDAQVENNEDGEKQKQKPKEDAEVQNKADEDENDDESDEGQLRDIFRQALRQLKDGDMEENEDEESHDREPKEDAQMESKEKADSQDMEPDEDEDDEGDEAQLHDIFRQALRHLRDGGMKKDQKPKADAKVQKKASLDQAKKTAKEVSDVKPDQKAVAKKDSGDKKKSTMNEDVMALRNLIRLLEDN